jgi:hypothetical protein
VKNMTELERDIVDTIRHYRKVLEQSKNKTGSLMNMAQFNGLMKGLDLALGKDKSQELYELATADEK